MEKFDQPPYRLDRLFFAVNATIKSQKLPLGLLNCANLELVCLSICAISEHFGVEAENYPYDLTMAWDQLQSVVDQLLSTWSKKRLLPSPNVFFLALS